MTTCWKTMPNGTPKYKAYLCSREWRQKCEAVRMRSKGTCERCHRDRAVNCHHSTYNTLYDEDLADLQDLCDGCHRFVHNKSSFDPLAYFTEAEPVEPFKVVTESCGQMYVQCPKCRSDLSAVHNMPDWIVERKGLESELRFWCECGHFFKWHLTYHKGHMEFEVLSIDRSEIINTPLEGML